MFVHDLKRSERRALPAAVLALAVLGLSGGCAVYRAQPLERASVDAALAAPKLADLRLAASQFKHPLLKPIKIDGRDGLTPDEIAVMAVIASPELRTLRDDAGIAHAQVMQAGLLPNPTLGFSLDHPHGNTDPTLVNGGSLGLDWQASALLTYRDNLEAARDDAKSVDLRIAWQEWQVAEDSRLHAYRLLSLGHQLVLARTLEKEQGSLSRQLALAAARHVASATEAAAAHDAWGQARSDVLDLEQQLRAETAALDLQLGRPADQPLVVKDDQPSLLARLASLDRNDLLGGLEARRLDLLALRLGYESGEASLRAAVKQQFPRLGVGINRSRDTSDIKSRGFSLSLELPLFDRNQAQIAALKATRQQLFDDYAARLAEARAQIVQIFGDLEETRARLESVQRELPAYASLAQAHVSALEKHLSDRASESEALRLRTTHLLEASRLRQSALELLVALEVASGKPFLQPPTPQR